MQFSGARARTVFRHRDFSHLEDGVAGVMHDLASNLTSFSRKLVSDDCATASGKSPVGRPPAKVRRYYASFSCRAQNWATPGEQFDAELTNACTICSDCHSDLQGKALCTAAVTRLAAK